MPIHFQTNNSLYQILKYIIIIVIILIIMINYCHSCCDFSIFCSKGYYYVFLKGEEASSY